MNQRMRKNLRLSRGRPASRGFTLLEVLVAMALVAILAAIALPTYQTFITKSRARSASADLMSLSTDLENTFQRTLTYPTLTTTTTANTVAATVGWSPAEDDFFTYKIASSATAYTLSATGTGNLAGCDLTLNQSNTRTITSDCGMSSW